MMSIFSPSSPVCFRMASRPALMLLTEIVEAAAMLPWAVLNNATLSASIVRFPVISAQTKSLSSARARLANISGT